MLYNKERDKKCTLLFKTKRGIKHSRPEEIGSNRTDEQITEHSEDDQTIREDT